MKNKERFASEIIEIAINSGNGKIAVNKTTGEPVACIGFDCNNCLLFGDCEDYTINSEGLLKWAESEHKEPLSAKTITDEFHQFCSAKKCTECEYRNSAHTAECQIRYVVENYNVTEREYNVTEREASK